MPTGTGTPTGSYLPLTVEKAAITSQSSGAKTIPYTSLTGTPAKALCVKVSDAEKSHSYQNFAAITFQKAASIAGRAINVKVEFTSMTIGPAQKGNASLSDDGLVCFARVQNNVLLLGDTEVRPYTAKKTIRTRITITWADTGDVVNLPFYQGIQDIDAAGDYFQESWEGLSGFQGTFYIWDTCKSSRSGNKIWAPQSYGTNGAAQWYETGAICPTQNGTMAMAFEVGNCANGLYLYSQYKDLKAPVKAVDKARVEKGETVTWKVQQTIGTFYRNTFSPYSSFSLTDVLPQGVTYQSARVYNGAGTDITGQGALTYTASTRTLQYQFSDSQLQNKALYIGQTFCMEIINALGHPTIAEFSSFVNISPPNAAYKINSLIQKGYITKEQSPDDKREYHLSVTQKYIDYYNVSYRYLSTVMDRIKERFPAQDVEKLEEMLNIISDELMPELNQIPSHEN